MRKQLQKLVTLAGKERHLQKLVTTAKVDSSRKQIL
jgi:hypothetical protein